jgi:hypothetical protein
VKPSRTSLYLVLAVVAVSVTAVSATLALPPKGGAHVSLTAQTSKLAEGAGQQAGTNVDAPLTSQTDGLTRRIASPLIAPHLKGGPPPPPGTGAGVVLRAFPCGGFPFSFGKTLAKGTTYPAKFEIAAGFEAESGEFEIKKAELTGSAAFSMVAGGTSCTAGFKFKKNGNCKVEVSLTPNKNPPERYTTTLKVKYVETGEPATEFEKSGLLEGENTT